jgi:hypothetical protein
MSNVLTKMLVSLGSIISIGFGIWHFFVPTTWKWYSYIDSSATELVVAIRAINIFFSLSLILFGIMNILLIYAEKYSKYSVIVVLVATCLLWASRVLLQIIFPQGTINPILQYGMLLSFIIVLLCYMSSLILVICN